MVLSKIRVSQNFCEISQVSQSRFSCRLLASRSLKFCKVVSHYRSQSRILKGKKVSGSQRKNASSLAVTLSLAFYHDVIVFVNTELRKNTS